MLFRSHWFSNYIPHRFTSVDACANDDHIVEEGTLTQWSDPHRSVFQFWKSRSIRLRVECATQGERENRTRNITSGGCFQKQRREEWVTWSNTAGFNGYDRHRSLYVPLLWTVLPFGASETQSARKTLISAEIRAGSGYCPTDVASRNFQITSALPPAALERRSRVVVGSEFWGQYF